MVRQNVLLASPIVRQDYATSPRRVQEKGQRGTISGTGGGISLPLFLGANVKLTSSLPHTAPSIPLEAIGLHSLS
jgi:hypothetical protein